MSKDVLADRAWAAFKDWCRVTGRKVNIDSLTAWNRMSNNRPEGLKEERKERPPKARPTGG